MRNIKDIITEKLKVSPSTVNKKQHPVYDEILYNLGLDSDDALETYGLEPAELTEVQDVIDNWVEKNVVNDVDYFTKDQWMDNLQDFDDDFVYTIVVDDEFCDEIDDSKTTVLFNAMDSYGLLIEVSEEYGVLKLETVDYMEIYIKPL